VVLSISKAFSIITSSCLDPSFV